MPPLDATGIISLWEQEPACSGFSRTLSLLEVARPEASASQRLAMSLGQCHRALLELRAETFGDEMESEIECPACGEGLELELSAARLCASQPEHQPELIVEHEGWRVRARAIRCTDVLECLRSSCEEEAQRVLLRRCVVEIDGPSPGDAGLLPVGVRRRLEDALEDVEPLADVRTRIQCAHCGHDFVVSLDVAGFVWEELDAEARRLIAQIHVLGRTYGWRPRDVLDLSPRLRRHFMELAQA